MTNRKTDVRVYLIVVLSFLIFATEGCGIGQTTSKEELNRYLLSTAASGSSAEVQSLIQNGADPLVKDPQGLLPIHIAAANGNAGAVEAFLVAGLSPNSRDGYGRTALHVVLARNVLTEGTVLVMQKLFEKGVDPNLGDHAGYRPIHAAIHLNSPELVKFLLERKVIVDAPGEHGVTALYIAVTEEKSLPLIESLLSGGANPNLVIPSTGQSALDASVKLKNKNISVLLEKYSRGNAVKSGEETVIKTALKSTLKTLGSKGGKKKAPTSK